MKIDKIELNGFKSFSQKTILKIQPGITCIVGPNGCGKSNTFDAFKWVLGEQSAKNLRGDKMEEIIFNGSATEKPKAMAEVALHISDIKNKSTDGNGKNDDRATVTRRLFRSGESEYRINNKKSRLKDVREIFLDTGMEVKSYSFIEQGRIGEILNAKPLERRYLIEEVAGIIKYKIKRAEAQSKLELSRANLTQVSLLTEEVKRSLDSLERQMKKAIKYQELSELLKSLELNIAKNDYSLLNGQLSYVQNTINECEKALSDLKSNLTLLEQKKDERGLVLSKEKSTLEDLFALKGSTEKDISNKEKDIAVWDNELENTRMRIRNLNEFLVDIDDEEKDAKKRLSEVKAKELEFNDKSKNTGKKIELIREHIQTMETEYAYVGKKIKAKNSALFKLSGKVSDLSNEIKNMTNTLGGLKEKFVSSQKDIERAKTDRSFHDKKSVELSARAVEEETVLNKTKENTKNLSIESSNLEGKIESTRKNIQDLREEIASKNARLKSLEEITQIKHVDNMESGIPLTDILLVPKEHEETIEGALSLRLKGMVLPNREEVKRAVDFVWQHKGKKRVFMAGDLPLCSNTPTPIPLALPALSVIKSKDGYQNMVNAMLKGFYIVEGIDDAFKLREKGEEFCSVFYVTKNGTVIEPSGAVICGQDEELLKHTRQIRTLKEEISLLDKRLTEFNISFEKSKDAKINMDKTLKESEQLVVTLDKEISDLLVDVKKHDTEKQRIDRKIKYIEMEGVENQKEADTLKASLSTKQQEVDNFTAEQEGLNNCIDSLEKKTQHDKKLLENTRTTLTEKQVEHTRITEALKALSNDHAQTKRQMETIQQRRSSSEKELDFLEINKDDLSLSIARNKEEITLLSSKLSTLNINILKEQEKISLNNVGVQETESSINKIRAELDVISSKQKSMEISQAELKIKINSIKKTIQENYDIDIEEVNLTEIDTTQPVDEIRKKIKNLGNINMQSIEEYGETKKRFDFLSDQQNDLMQSTAELEEVINKINTTTKKILWDSFNKLNEKFAETFAFFFDGGKAELILTDTSNILDAGIDIVVQPPGKRLQNINLLSGGEKTLSAISLIFAGFLIKPTPLCILDEADAALDEANSTRFSAMLKKLSHNTQFIVITHKRSTMEIADHLYGISSEVAGVSKIVSIAFNRASTPPITN